jgi:sec-independent protein translocase protein TatA
VARSAPILPRLVWMGLDNPLHIAFLVVILLLVFGARRLPEIGRSLGSGLREFKQSINGESSPDRGAPDSQPALPAGREQPHDRAQPAVRAHPAGQPGEEPAPVARGAFAQRDEED